LLAYLENTLTGIVKIEKIAAGFREFGMLAVDPDGLRIGVGGALVAEAEAWARTMGFAEIEIVRTEEPNSHKRLLHEWYTHLGYIEQRTYPIFDCIPEIAALQHLTFVSTVYRKPLD
jgi:GNAT superfamily N-acetyltransferase